MSKRPMGHGNLRYMGNFKAVAADYEYYLSLEDVGRLYCLTDRQVYVLMVQLEYVGWLTRWYNTDDITQTTVGYIQSELMERLMSCVDIQVLMDQAALNLSDSVTSKAIESMVLRDILEDRYDGSPASVNPNAPTTDFGASGDRYDALCAGLMAFVYQFARAQADSIRAGQIGGLAATALIALLLIPGLNFFFVVGASIAVLLGMGTIGVSTETAIQALTDKTALDAVVCYTRDTLKAQGVTQANWDACLNSYPFGVGTHEAIVADFLKACLHDNYLTILNILGQAYTGVINGDQVPQCPCEPTICVEYDFTAGAFGWSGLYETDYVPGQGWERSMYNNTSVFLASSPIIVHRITVRFITKQPTSIGIYTGPGGMTPAGALTYNSMTGDWAGDLATDIPEGARIEIGATGPIDDGILQFIEICPLT